jgi:hypothetical protein
MPAVVHAKIDVDVKAWIRFFLAGVRTLRATGLDLSTRVTVDVNTQFVPVSHIPFFM